MSLNLTVQNLTPNPPRKISSQMRAVLSVFAADQHLMEAVGPFIDYINETIDWDAISMLPLGSGHQAAAAIAYGLWTDQQRPNTNFFDSALNMDANLKASVLRALALRWGLKA